MKTYFWFIIGALLILSSCSSPNAQAEAAEESKQFVIEGKLDAAEEGTKVFLAKYVDDAYTKLDSMPLKDGNFRFQGQEDIPQRYYLSLNNSKKRASFFVSTGNMTVTGSAEDLREAVITGSMLEDEYQDFKKNLQPYEEQFEALNPEFKLAQENKDEAKYAELEKKHQEIKNAQTSLVEEYIKNNATSMVTPYIAYRYISFEHDITADKLKEVLAIFPASSTGSPYIGMMDKKMQTMDAVSIGKVAPDFALPDPQGIDIALSSLRGKYVLVDFWASWCGPCRKENPNVVKLYADLKGTNFEILSVSFDKKRDKWLEAIEADNLTWTHISDLKGWQSAAGQLYGINSIPHTVLIDPEGVILAHGLDAAGVRERLKQ